MGLPTLFCFDIDRETGLEIYGEVIIEDRDLGNQAWETDHLSEVSKKYLLF